MADLLRGVGVQSCMYVCMYTRVQSELCRYWEAGHCNSGAECQFAHGVEELRPHQPAAPAGGEAAVGGGGGLGRRGPARRGRSGEGGSSGGSGEGLANPRYKVGSVQVAGGLMCTYISWYPGVEKARPARATSGPC